MMSQYSMAQPDHAFKTSTMSNSPWNPARNSYTEPSVHGSFDNSFYSSQRYGDSRNNTTSDILVTLANSSLNYSASNYNLAGGLPIGTNGQLSRPESAYPAAPSYGARPPSGSYGKPVGHGSYKAPTSQSWENQDRYSPTDSVDDIIASPNLSDYSMENGMNNAAPGGKAKSTGKGRSQRRPSNRDEFDGPHQFLQRPPPDVIAMQERELPHLPTNLHVQEQDSVLSQVNDRLSQCAFDFVAKYQFPIPLTQDMRPVERPQDREWTEWVYLLKRLATKRRIPARVLYNGQIKQFVTILENSLEMRHAAKHQSRPLKDDRNILQLISAGIQVAKILKDASAMDYLDRLYVSTDKQIQDRAATRYRA
ncbi:hypothetical protein HG530_003615 [Fusarium avenaceum]|uniref:Uncharacterized protein n=1 Tax=Fusarium avenaceum TaxID=40199 RepID=A0A9P7KQ28_9HYPO|nr:hypothetical protein KAF25_005663 [Fusarium avenaceum]KAH6964302.1 hypothetical protein DER45DRAFT_535506 [Fusarium avenaceum]KAI6772657.1 hypothetical protein HG530_003615 [Fusarium avenaceum]